MKFSKMNFGTLRNTFYYSTGRKVKLFLKLFYFLKVFCFVFVFMNYGFATILVRSTLELNSTPSDSLLNPGNFLNLDEDLKSKVQVFVEEKVSLFDERLTFKFSDMFSVFPKGNATSFTNRLNEFYLSYSPCSCLFIDLGKVTVKTGVGYFKNPSDFLITRILSSSESKESLDRFTEGRIMSRVEFLVSEYSFDLLFSPSITWDSENNKTLNYFSSQYGEYKVLAMFNGSFEGVNFNPIVCYDGKFKSGLNISYVFGENLEIHFEGGLLQEEEQKLVRKKEVIVSNTVIGETNGLDTITLYWVPSVVLGGHYTFANVGINLMFEYYFNGKGLDAEEWFSTIDKFKKVYDSFYYTNNFTNYFANVFALASLNTAKDFLDFYGFTGVVKHYSMLRFYKDFEGGLSFETINLNNLVDFSGMVISRIEYTADNYFLTFSLTFPYGDKESEFGLIVDNFVVSLVWELEF